MENVIELSASNSLLNHYLAEMRDEHLQKDKARFRENMEACGFILGYEISKKLDYSQRPVKTPLANTTVALATDQVVVVGILRAALPLQMGMLKAFRNAEAAFVAAYRKHEEGVPGFEIVSEYEATPNLEGKTVVLVDPMLATGSSMITCYERLMEGSKPKQCIVASVFSSKEGVNTLKSQLPQIVHYTCVIDAELDHNKYIVPGLGDAGDLAFGEKVEH